MNFFYNYMANETKTNLQIIVQNKRRYVWKNLQYDEMNWKKKKDYVTLNKYDS